MTTGFLLLILNVGLIGWMTLLFSCYPILQGRLASRYVTGMEASFFDGLRTKRSFELMMVILGIGLSLSKVVMPIDLTSTAIPMTLIASASLVITLYTQWEYLTTPKDR